MTKKNIQRIENIYFFSDNEQINFFFWDNKTNLLKKFLFMFFFGRDPIKLVCI